jgi:tetratricopeptide (TPR) repeat protein
MADIKIIRWAAVLLFSVLLVCGCQPAQKGQAKDETLIDPETRKLELQRKLTKRYNDPEIHYELGKIYQSEGLWDKARFKFTFAKGYNPVHWKSAAAIVKTYYQDGKNSRAVEMAARYLKQANYSASASLNLGKALQDEMLADEAFKCYSQALRIAPDSAKLNKQIGLYYLEKNDMVRAEEFLTRSFEIDPSEEVSAELGKLGIQIDLPRLILEEPEETGGMIEEGVE